MRTHICGTWALSCDHSAHSGSRDLPGGLGGPPGKVRVSILSCWAPREFLTPGNINWQELSQRSPYWTKSWLQPKSCKLQCSIPQAKQQAREEHSLTNYQTGCLKSYYTHRYPQTHPLTRPCLPKGQDPASPTRAQAQIPTKKKLIQASGQTRM